jgi:NTE family protein
MLSGGATLGFHHLGVVKALFQAGLLPDILSGASTGAMIAAGIGARNDAEVEAMYADTDQMRLDGLAPVSLRQLRSNGGILDPARLHAVLRHNIGDRTFAEAYAHSGRTLNISVSATRSKQKPRLLTHLTSPQVLVASAALASSALPGLFPPVELEMRDRDGREVPYIDGERWTDGSLDGDLPKTRMARLHNVNHFIVSQTNPHVLPFVAHHGRTGLVPIVGGLVGAAARTQGAYAADLFRRATQRTPGALQLVANQAHNALTQDYRGHIDIHPRFHWSLYKKVVRNPTRADLARFILEGERSVWPLMARIRNDTRIGRAFEACVATLEKNAAREA